MFSMRCFIPVCTRNPYHCMCECDAELSLASIKYSFVTGENSGLFGASGATGSFPQRNKSNFNVMFLLESLSNFCISAF